MNFTQMHERLRQELWRRIQRGTASVSLLSRQTGLTQAHLSNFLQSKRQLSLQAMDRVLAAQSMTAAELLPPGPHVGTGPPECEKSAVPVVSHATALFEPFVRSSAIQFNLHLRAGLLESLRRKPSNQRRASWQRFVAVRIPSADTLAMEPLVLPDALVLIDRHYNQLMPYRPTRPNLYAVRNGAHLVLRYLDFTANRLVLRPHNQAYPVELMELNPGETLGDLITGRVALIFNEA